MQIIEEKKTQKSGWVHLRGNRQASCRRLHKIRFYRLYAISEYNWEFVEGKLGSEARLWTGRRVGCW